MTVTRLRALLLAAAATFSMCVPSLLAQSAGTGALTGTVTDPSGAVIPGVAVTATNTDTNQTRAATSGENGFFQFTLLPPGSYRVRFTANGFKIAEATSVTLTVTETATLNRTLELGSQADQVIVEANAETLQVASSTLGTTVTSASITALPLATRNFTQVLGMSTGV
ncbi:MAG: carboxypeptidase-like regulatory domain-containing protein, partial [Candidatus Angelobacter sp.]